MTTDIIDCSGDNYNIFDYLPREITTVNSILEAIENKNNPDYEHPNFRDKTETAVKQLNIIHAYNDDLFNIFTNKVMSADDILREYRIKI